MRPWSFGGGRDKANEIMLKTVSGANGDWKLWDINGQRVVIGSSLLAVDETQDRAEMLKTFDSPLGRIVESLVLQVTRARWMEPQKSSGGARAMSKRLTITPASKKSAKESRNAPLALRYASTKWLWLYVIIWLWRLVTFPHQSKIPSNHQSLIHCCSPHSSHWYDSTQCWNSSLMMCQDDWTSESTFCFREHFPDWWSRSQIDSELFKMIASRYPMWHWTGPQ
jgi:hypothetical protein